MRFTDLALHCCLASGFIASVALVSAVETGMGTAIGTFIISSLVFVLSALSLLAAHQEIGR